TMQVLSSAFLSSLLFGRVTSATSKPGAGSVSELPSTSAMASRIFVSAARLTTSNPAVGRGRGGSAAPLPGCGGGGGGGYGASADGGGPGLGIGRTPPLRISSSYFARATGSIRIR